MNNKPYQQCFSRYEIKYLISEAQRMRLEAVVFAHMSPDVHGESEIRNIYYDTPDFRLIRHSLEGPVYKEKLRMRSYGRAGEADDVFLEIKKKYDQVVYKRRIALPQGEAVAALGGGAPLPQSQIGSEIDRFRMFYPDLAPRVFLSYARTAYFSKEDPGVRVTFDRNIRWRDTALSLDSEPDGDPLLDPDRSLMEIKTPGAIPLWLTARLTEAGVFKTSFSKYGRAYEDLRGNKKIMRCQICSTSSFPEYSAARQLPA